MVVAVRAMVEKSLRAATMIMLMLRRLLSCCHLEATFACPYIFNRMVMKPRIVNRVVLVCRSDAVYPVNLARFLPPHHV